MMYFGAAQLGQHISLRLVTTNASGTPVLPAAAPVCKVWNAAGTLAFNARLPIEDRYGQTAFFKHKLFLDSGFAAGQCQVEFTYTITSGSYNAVKVGWFTILAGGDSGGTVISMYRFARPHAQFVLKQMDSDALRSGRNPML